MKKTEKNEQKKPFFSLRLRLVVLVTAEMVFSVMLAVWISDLLDRYLRPKWELPLLLYLVAISLLVGILVTGFLSRLFFDPIKKLRQAMSQVAQGDFSTQLQTRSGSREIRDIYAGFNLMTHELRATEILQTDFVSNVSHEFKTPLSAIEGYSTLLQDGENLTPEQQRYVEKIIFNTQRLSSLTGSILLLSKLENQQIPTNRSHFSLDEQIRHSIVALEPEWNKKQIEFDVELEAAQYYGSEPLLRQVWDNLLRNAVKFSPPEGQVRVSLNRSGKHLLIRVEDEGPGIAPEAIDHIFDKFYQADSSHKQEGNGLGLSLVDKIMKLEKGSITAENLPQGGCRFTVRLESK